jgi:Mrp family chromosome partitioning ATPase
VARIVLAAGAEPSRLAIAHCTSRQRGRVPAVELARAWASRNAQLDGKPVVLVRADDSLAQDDPLRGLEGLSDLIRDRGDVNSMGFQVEGGVEVVPLGTTSLRPEDLVPITRVRTALDRLAQLGAPMIIDAPPVLSGLAGEILPAAADAVVIVVDPRAAPRHHTAALRSALDKASVRLVGAVIAARRRPAWRGDRVPRSARDGAAAEPAVEPTPAVAAR